MGDVEQRRGRDLERRRCGDLERTGSPHLDLALPREEARELVREALGGTSILDPAARALGGWWAFHERLRFTELEPALTRVEIDVASRLRWAEALLYPQRRAEIDRFLVAIRDEVDRRIARRGRVAPEPAPEEPREVEPPGDRPAIEPPG